MASNDPEEDDVEHNIFSFSLDSTFADESIAIKNND